MTYNVMAPNDTAYKRWSCHSGHKILSNQPAPINGGPIYHFWGKPAMRTRWMAGAASHKVQQDWTMGAPQMRRYPPSTIHRYPGPCHLHRESRLTAHTDITPPRLSRPWSKPPTHSPPIPPTPPATETQTHALHSPCSHRIGKAQPQSSHPPTPSTHTPPRAKHIDGEIPKASNSTFGNCSGEGKNCPILLIHY